MSWYNTVVLSFSCAEWDDETSFPPKSFNPLRTINKWLKQQTYAPLANLTKLGDLGSNAVLFGGCYNHMDIEAFCQLVQSVEWRNIEDVQILFWSDNDVKFSVITFPTNKKFAK